ncbi:MAG: hypothetical protein FP820_02505 [Sulfurimonas sp.]|nr:hypothetical protein [Sulfurimonas sp.]MBU3938054.1 caspase family protein [bacterium]
MKFLKLNFLLLTVIVFLAGCGSPQISEHVKMLMKAKTPDITLELDTKGHTAGVLDILVTQDQSELVTASNDKTIRVWDINTGEEKRKILGEIGNGSFGEIFAIALSTNDKYLAVGGFFPGENGKVRIYNYKSGKIIQTLNLAAINSIVNDLSFSKDSKYLISANSAGTSYIWDVENNFTLVDTIKEHLSFQTVYAAKIIKKGNQYFAVTAGFDGKIILYDIEKKKLVQKKYLGGDLAYLATTEVNGGNIALSDLRVYSKQKAGKIRILDFDLNLLQTIETESEPVALKYSEDGKFLIAGGSNFPYYVSIFKVDKHYTKTTSFKKHTEITKAVNFLNNDTAVSVGGTNNEIYLWNAKTAKVQRLIKGVGNTISRVAIQGNNIAWGNIPHNDKNGILTSLEYSMNLQSYTFSKDIEKFKVLSKVNGEYTVSDDADKGKYHSRLDIKQNGKKISEIHRGNASGVFHKTYGWYKDYVVSGGGSGTLYAYDKNGKIVTTLHGHKSDIFSIDVDEDRLISGSADQTIKIWDLTKVGKDKVIYPLVNLFIAEDKSWTMWTEEGYFTQSTNALNSIYFHLNNGPFKEATEIGIEKLYDHFFRPDLVKLKLQGNDISKYTNGMTYQDVLKDPPPKVSFIGMKSDTLETNKESASIGFNVAQVDNGGVGLIRVYQEGKLVQTIGEGEVKRKGSNVQEELQQNKLDALSKSRQKEYLANLDTSLSKSLSKPLDDSELVSDVLPQSTNNDSGSFSVILPLKAGKNSIEIEAFNKTNTVLSIRESITINAKIKKHTPKIYALVLGVNEFEHPNASTLRFSENDAKTMAEKIQNATEYKTEVTLLTGKEVTKQNIQKAIADIKKKAHLEDKIIFYISTHGKAIRGNLYLVPQNNSSAKNWLNFEKLFQEIQSIAALDQIFIIDACESGKASDVMSSVYDAKASVLAKQSGVHVLMATTKGTFAFESADPKIKHGVFTNNILKALDNKSTDKDRDGWISVVELSQKLQEPENNVQHQFPIIRNVGQDTNIEKLK